MRRLLIALLLLGAALPAAPRERAGSYLKGGTAYAVGESVRVVAAREQAELAALKDAIARISVLLEAQGLGSRREIALGVENAVLREGSLGSLRLGKARIDSVIQERWEAPEGRDAWSVRVKISVRLR